MLDSLLDEVYLHAEKTNPHECCGLAVVIKGKLKYIPCTNLLSGDAFCIPAEEYAKAEDLGEIVGVCHSHVNILPEPSQADLIACEKSNLPWLIVSYPSKSYKIIEPQGFKPPLIGRPFYHGILDCYTLVRDYYKETLNIQLNDFHRDDQWWDKGQDLYIDNFEAEGFVIIPDIKDLKVHDSMLMTIGSNIVNHAAVYIGDNMILQHCTNRLSSRDIYGGFWRKCTRHIVRHKSLL
jgi:proteasome lid subunit RPN8/RPN11